MIGGFIFLVVLTAVVAGAMWFADRPGAVSIVWQGYQIDTSVAVLLFAVAVIAIIVALIYRFWRFIARGPKSWGRLRRDGRRRRGYEALTKGMVAVAAGDPAEARRQSRRAEVLLDEPPLTLLLSAQAAQLAGDSGAAARYFDTMLERPEMEFLGLRGLLNEATRAGDTTAALSAARRAHALRPRSEWVLSGLFDLEIRAGEWDRAERVLKDAAKRGVFTDAETARRRAIILYEKGRASGAAEGTKLLRRSRDADRAFLPAALALAEREIDAGRNRQAARIIEESWRVLPTAEAAAIYLQTIDEKDPLKRLKVVGRLAATNQGHAESHLVIARAALDAKLWGQARHHLAAAAEDAPTTTVFRLLAELEEAEHGDAGKARYWLARAADARPDPGWICDGCGTVATAWQTLCGHCGAFDSLHWRSRARLAALAAPAPPDALPILTLEKEAEVPDAPADPPDDADPAEEEAPPPALEPPAEKATGA
jgi:HemY protein